MRNFRNLTGLRSITFNGYNSLTNYNILITKNTAVNDTTPRTPSVRLPYRQGRLRGSRASGTLMFDERVLTYEFKLIADTPQAIQALIESVTNWLYSHDTDTIQDSFIPGYVFTDCECTGITDSNESEDNICIHYLTATFTADPFMTAIGGGN